MVKQWIDKEHDMNYKEITNTIYNKRRFGKAPGRDVTKAMLELFDHPDLGMKIIHIAGTNGKGSTAATLDQLLREAGFRTGLFTSPHLIDFAERIRVSGEKILHEDVERLGEEILTELELHPEIEDTMFDDALVMALLYFKEQACDYVILETGLGGRLDSTSGLTQAPVLTMITRIGLDHTAILGNSLDQIAREKAGILHAGIPLVLAENEKEAELAIREVATELGSPIIDSPSLLRKVETYLTRYPSSLSGDYQKENLRSALLAFLYLIQETAFPGKEVENMIRKGLSRVSWPGRMQILSEDPFLLIDGAHNPQGIQALHDSLLHLYGKGPYIFLTGVLRDKDFSQMVALMAGLSDRVITVTVDNPRALPGVELAKLYQEAGLLSAECMTLEDALSTALSEAKQSGRKVVAFGSLYFIGALLQRWEAEDDHDHIH